ncbi:MAG: universal stress protein [Nitrosopumilus sp.]|nr:universal stress protein [Nitrosopumilus sp.]
MNKIFEHILVPYNGCPGSQKAFKKSVELAKVTQSKITIFTCLEERSTFGFFKTKTSKQEFEKEHKLVREEHVKLEKNAENQGVSLNSKIIKSNMASESILEFAEKHDVDLIVMGLKKQTRHEKIYYPSTIEAVFKNFQGAILVLN